MHLVNRRIYEPLSKNVIELYGRMVFLYTHFYTYFCMYTKNCQIYYRWIHLSMMIDEMILFFGELIKKVVSWSWISYSLFDELERFPFFLFMRIIFDRFLLILVVPNGTCGVLLCWFATIFLWVTKKLHGFTIDDLRFLNQCTNF